MSKIYIVTKRESGIYEEDGVWFSILAAFDTRNKAEEYLKKYVKTAPKEAYYTFYRIESVPLFLSSHKVKINRPKHTTYRVSLNKSKTAYCVNCGTKLPFTLIREGEEQVE